MHIIGIFKILIINTNIFVKLLEFFTNFHFFFKYKIICDSGIIFTIMTIEKEGFVYVYYYFR